MRRSAIGAALARGQGALQAAAGRSREPRISRRGNEQHRAGRLAATLKELPVNAEQARQLGWYYAQETLSDGSELYYFPLIAIGHGVLTVYSTVLYDKQTGTATVVQAAPFCADMRGALRRLVRAVRAAL